MMTKKHISLFVLFAFLTAAPASAQTMVTSPNPVAIQPQTSQLPRGTDWQAIILTIQKGQEPTLVLRLTQKVGNCVQPQADNHHLGDTVAIGILPGQIPNFQVGQMVHVWVNHSASLLAQPLCQYH